MNQTNSQFQLSGSENHPPSFISTSYNSQDNGVLSPQAVADTYHVTNVVRSSQTQINSSENQIKPVHPTVFFYRSPNESYHYYVQCKEIPYDTIPCLLGRNIQFNDSEFIFFYRQQHNNRFYQVTCEVVPHLLINHCLNKYFLGIEIQQDMGQENLAFTAEQKENLEYHVKQRLSQYLLN